MARRLSHLLLDRLLPSRSLSTQTHTYTGRVVQSDRTGRSISVTIDSPSPSFSYHPRGGLQPRNNLICHFSNLLLDRSSPDPFLSIADLVSSLESPLTSLEASLIIKSLKYPSTCLEFFNFLSTLPKFKHDWCTYNRILHIISRTEDTHLVYNLIDQMESEGIIGNVSTINILIGVLGVDGIKKCMDLVKKWGIKINQYTYKCMVQAYIRARDVKQGFRVYEEMRLKGFKLDIFAYNMLLHALVQTDMVEQARKVFDEMKKQHCKPDIYTYTTLIRMSGRIGTVPEFLSYFDEMISNGFEPNLISFNTMIQALGKNKMVDKMMLIFSKMIDNEIKPNEFTFSTILESLATEGKIHKINEILEISNKFMNRSIYAYSVRALHKLGYITEAHNIFCRMWSLYDKGDKHAFISMLEILCNNGKTLEAMDLLNMMKEKEINPDLTMYNLVFSSLGKLKQVPYMFQLFEKMKLEGISLDIFTYNIIISSLGRVGLVDKATELFEEMEISSDCKPDIISYNSLINCLGKNGELDEAHMRFKEMQEKGINPDVFTYSTLIECFGKSNRVEMAYNLFDEMLKEKCVPNIVTYNILLDCLARKGRVEEVHEIYEKLKEQGLSPDLITYSTMERLENRQIMVSRERKLSRSSRWVVSPLR